MRQEVVSKSSPQSQNGSGLIEVITSSIFVVAMAIFGLDIWIMVMGLQLNDTACRNAARAAAQVGDSSSALTAATAAIAAVNSQHPNSMGAPLLDSLNYIDYSSPNRPGIVPSGSCPYVQVTTHISLV